MSITYLTDYIIYKDQYNKTRNQFIYIFLYPQNKKKKNNYIKTYINLMGKQSQNDPLRILLMFNRYIY